MLPSQAQTVQIELPAGQKVYFASDFHLGTPSHAASRAREDKIVRWLRQISHDCHTLFLVGDIFDFWFEYRDVIPKGFIRLQGQLANMVDAGIQVIIFTGNHDMWMFDYFGQELGVEIVREPRQYQIGDHTFLIGHGDGLGPGDKAHKLLKRVFENRVCQRLFGFLHPYIGIGIATRWSKGSRAANLKREHLIQLESEWLYAYCQEQEATRHQDYYIFGHRHLPMNVVVNSAKTAYQPDQEKVTKSGQTQGHEARYINLGEWFGHCSYAMYDGQTTHLLYFNA